MKLAPIHNYTYGTRYLHCPLSIHSISYACLSVCEKRTSKRILIMMSNTGGGHRASAEAIKAAFQEKYGDSYEVGDHSYSELIGQVLAASDYRY